MGLAVAAVALGALVSLTPVADTLADGATDITVGDHHPPPRIPSTTADVSRCPWLEAAIDKHDRPAALAADVLGRMTVREKLGEIVLIQAGPYENIDAGVARLCIPALTLQDGPQGLAYGDLGVTQLPSPLGVAATFDTGLARTYGKVVGSEAAAQGIDVIQGPTLNIDRVPQSGRTYEGFGEDPRLVAAMGAADTEGIQSTGTLAMAKHFAVYNQETDRGVLDDQVTERALKELYLPPFEAAVTQAHVATAMCAYPRLNGTYQCEDPALLGQLAQWGFTGIIRSDLGSVHDPVAAIEAGVDLIKPASVRRLDYLVRTTVCPSPRWTAPCTAVLTVLFANGLVDRPAIRLPGDRGHLRRTHRLRPDCRRAVGRPVEGRRGALPWRSSAHRSMAVIGADAATAPVTSGYGSSRVLPPFTSSPLAAIRASGRTARHGDLRRRREHTGRLPPVPPRYLTPASGSGHGLTFTVTQTDPDSAGPVSLHTVQPTVDVSLSPHPTNSGLPTGAPLAARRSSGSTIR